MSSKLFGCVQYRLDKLFPDFITVWLDKDRMVHAVFDSKLSLSDNIVPAIKEHVREILFRNKELNLNYWCTCLPYKLQK